MNNDAIRRIDVDNEATWLQVQDNVRGGITSAMEARLSALPGGREGPAAKAIRGELEARLKKIHEEMFRLASANVRVNGHDYENYVASTEPFDEALDRTVQSNNVERVARDAEVAELRKKRPAAILRIEADLEKRKQAAEWLPEGEDDDANEDEEARRRRAALPRPERYDEVVQSFQEVVSNFSSLSQDAPVQLGRAERAKAVQAELARMKG